LQDVLGDIHDAHAWGAELRNTLQQAAVQEGQALTRMSAGKVAPRRRSRLPSRTGLAALAERIRQHGTESYHRLQTEWLGDGVDRFFADTGALLDALGELSAPHVEVERKYLLREFPHPVPPAARLLLIDQGYLPGERLIERLRRVQDDHAVRHYRTVKFGNGVSRTELEEETTRDIFATMWKLTEGKRLTKRRYVIPEGDLNWEIDQFTDRELILAEIELPDENYPVKIPEWLAPYVEREVTGEREFLNSTLAR
jgi:CYTH domain-containing protein